MKTSITEGQARRRRAKFGPDNLPFETVSAGRPKKGSVAYGGWKEDVRMFLRLAQVTRTVTEAQFRELFNAGYGSSQAADKIAGLR